MFCEDSFSYRERMIYEKINIGCGLDKHDDEFGIDINPRSNADMIFDLNVIPWDIEDSKFESVRCDAILEHLHHFYGVMEEIWRISKNGTKTYINVPHFSDFAMYTDPTHVKFFSSNSFSTLTGDSKWSYYTDARYEIVSLKIRLKSLFKLIGLEFIINASKKSKKFRSISKFWESYLPFIVTGKIIEVILEVKN
jgi:ubiquinone/menaquinone biosynthesis C-methylase UbiE